MKTGRIAWLALGLLCACSRPERPDARAELERSLKGADVKGYFLSTGESEARRTTALTHGKLPQAVTLEKDAPGVALRYTAVEDASAGGRKVYRTEIVRSDGELKLAVKDVATDEAILDQALPLPGLDCFEGHTFPSLSACTNAFRCPNEGPLTCEANKTCQPQSVALTCCLTDGNNFSVHLIFPPTSKRCLLTDLVSQFDGLVLAP